MEKEKWKYIKGYEGIYKISNNGRVYSIKRNGTSGGFLVGRINQFGYHVYLLRKNNVRKYVFSHRLVGFAFIKNPENKPQINHKDENKLNNNVKNLEWCTAKENANYGSLPLRRSIAMRGLKFSQEAKNKMSEIQKKIARRGKDSPCSIKVLQFSSDLNLIKTWDSYADIQRELGFYSSNIGQAVKKGIKSYGFIWKTEK